MVWTDVSYRTLRQLVIDQEESGVTGCLHNALVAEQIIQGYIARQVLAIRRLLDETGAVRFECTKTGAEFDRLWPALVELHQRRWQAACLKLHDALEGELPGV